MLTHTDQSNLVVRVNFAKCNVAMRTELFERYATRFFGDTTAKLYGTMLRMLERKLFRCRDEVVTKIDDEEDDNKGSSLPSVTTVEILDALDPSLDLASAIARDDTDSDGFSGHYVDDQGIRPSKGRHDDYNIDGDFAPSAMKARNKRLNEIEQHMRMLAEHPRGFVDRIGTRGKGEWRVEFNSLTESLQGAEVESVISARFGTVSARVVRLLKQKGKLEQKQIEEGCMVRKRDAQAMLSNMQELGIVETQEVPRDAARQPSRAFYLWYFDQDRVAKMLLLDTYKAMSRLLQRIQVQKSFRQEVIDKAERLDVIGHEDAYLTLSDKTHLRDWREEEEKLLTQLMRQDDIVALLRDF